MARGHGRRRNREEPFQGSGVRPRLTVQNPHGHGNHGRSLSRGAPALSELVRVHVGLGANLGDAEAMLAAGVRALAALPGSRLVGVSRLYATTPVGVLDQPEFRNAVAALDVPGGPDPATGAVALLVALKAIERAFGRRRRARWGPRELDLDVLVFGDAELAVDRPPAGLSIDPVHAAAPGAEVLVVPHRSLPDRLFALAPLADLAPELVPPGWTETVAEAATRRRAVEGPGAVRPIARWDDAAGWRPLEPEPAPGRA